MRAPVAAGARASRRRPPGGLRGRRRGDAPGAAPRLVPRAHVAGQGGVRRRPRRRARLAAAVASAVRRRARRAGRRGRARRADGHPRVAGACREPPGLASGHAVARGLDPPAPRRGARSGRRLRRRAELLPLALPLAHGVDRADDARAASTRRSWRSTCWASSTIAVGMWLLVRALGGGTPAAATGTVLAVAGGGFGWIWQHGPAAVLNMSARRPRPLPRRPGALECARPRNGQPAAARPARPGGLHGPARPVGLRAGARRAVAGRPPRRRRRPAASRSCARRWPGSSSPLWAAALALRARATVAASGRPPPARPVAGIWLAPLAHHLPPLRRLRRHHLAAAGQPDGGTGGRRARSRAAARNRRPRPGVARRCQAPMSTADPWRLGDPRRDPRGRMRPRRRDRRGRRRSSARRRSCAGCATCRSWRSRWPSPPASRPSAASAALARLARPAAALALAAGIAAAVASTALAAVELGRAPTPATLRCGPLPFGYGDVFAVVSKPQLGGRPGLARRLRADRRLGGLHDARAGEGATRGRSPTGRPPRPSGVAGATSSGRAARRSPAACGSSPTPARPPRRAAPG